MPDDNQTTQPSTTDPLDTSNPTPTVSDPVAPIIPPAPVIPEVPETKTETPTEPLPGFINMDLSVPTPPPSITEETPSPFKPVVEEQTSMPEETPPIIQDGSSAPSFDIPPVITPPEKPKAKLGGKVIATILGILLLVGGIGAGLYLVGQQQDLNKRASTDECGTGIGIGDKACMNNTQYSFCRSGGHFDTPYTSCSADKPLCRGADCVNPAGNDTGNDTPTDTSGGTKKCDDGIAERANGYISCLDNAQPAKCNGSNRNWDPQAHCSVGSICVVGSGCQTCTEAQKAAHNGCDFAASVTETGSDTSNTAGETTCNLCTSSSCSIKTQTDCTVYHYWCQDIKPSGVGCQDAQLSAGSSASFSQDCGTEQIDVSCTSSCGATQSNYSNTSQGIAWMNSNAGKLWIAKRYATACSSTTTNTETNTDTPICQNIKAYDTSWNALTADQLKTLKVGDVVKLTVKGANGTFDKAQFKINGAATWTERTDKKPSTEEFFIDYTIPAGITTFNVEAQVHVTGGVWK
jgi:hypothetical protein